MNEPETTPQHVLDALEDATFDDLWFELASRCDAAVLTCMMPDRSETQRGHFRTAYFGSRVLAIGLLRCAEADLLKEQSDEPKLPPDDET